MFPFQLSSRCDNRLFCIKFEILQLSRFPFFEVISQPIRCISRNRNPRTRRKSPSGVHLVNGSQSPEHNDGSSELLHNIVCEAKQSPSSKRVKLGQDKPFSVFNDAFTSKQPDEECNSHALTTNEVNHETCYTPVLLHCLRFWSLHGVFYHRYSISLFTRLIMFLRQTAEEDQ